MKAGPATYLKKSGPVFTGPRKSDLSERRPLRIEPFAERVNVNFENTMELEKSCTFNYRGKIREMEQRGERGGTADNMQCQKSTPTKCATQISKAIQEVSTKNGTIGINGEEVKTGDKQLVPLEEPTPIQCIPSNCDTKVGSRPSLWVQ